MAYYLSQQFKNLLSSQTHVHTRTLFKAVQQLIYSWKSTVKEKSVTV